jgi:hypothetical protein
MKPALAVALLGGMSLLATSPLLVSQQGGDTYTGEDHGDNPVVGSLPCEVAPDLDLIFGGTAPARQSILGLLGGTALESQILDAVGTPYGLVNRPGGTPFTIFGLVHDGSMTLKRSDAAKALMLLQLWLPDEYLGGSVTMTSSVGSPTRTITSNLVDLPLMMLAAAPGPVADARIVMRSASGAVPARVVYISVVGNLLTVSYVP